MFGFGKKKKAVVTAVVAEDVIPAISLPDLAQFLNLAGVADYETLKAKAHAQVRVFDEAANDKYADATGIREIANREFDEETKLAVEKRSKKLLRASEIEATANDLHRKTNAGNETLFKLP